MKTCPFCKASIKRKRIEHVHRWGVRKARPYISESELLKS